MPRIQKRHTIEATQPIIDRAVTRDSSHCVIADAVRASIPGATRVAVDLQTIRWTVDGRRYVALTPRAGQACILQFDQGIVPEPFRLRIEAFQVVKAGNHARGGDREIEPGEVVAGGSSGKSIKAPKVTGGQLPPQGALSDQPRTGRRRTFGLRLLHP